MNLYIFITNFYRKCRKSFKNIKIWGDNAWPKETMKQIHVVFYDAIKV